ncbi:MAG: hypothetical protein U9N61_00170 [Euryarchaeota archaeon]|nr:hypothetical protein [Euryarchaeota archaeon]
MIEVYVSVDGLTWQKPNGRYVDEIELDERVNHLIDVGTADELMLEFKLIGKSIHQGTIDARRLNAYVQLARLKQAVEDLLVEAGWEVHIVDPIKTTEAEDYIHSTGGTLQVHQVPFSGEWNIELELNEMCDQNGKIRSKEETLALLKERIGVDTFDSEELSKDDADHIRAIMKAEELDLENLHDVCGRGLTTGAMSFEWFRDEEEAEEEAREYLTDDPELWKMAVAAGNTTDGLEEWVEDVLNIDGWGQTLGGYDGEERTAQLRNGQWFPYIRTD